MRNTRRKIMSHLVVGLCGAAVLLSLVPLVLILFYVLQRYLVGGLTAGSVKG